jgi:hypothetical protein
MAETIKIGGELESMATGKVVAAASAIKDKARGKTQDIINTDVEDALASQTSRIDDTNVKVAVNERKINSVRELVESHEFEQGIVQYANDVYCNVDGLDSANVQSALGELATEVFPLKVAILTTGSNGGNYEITDAEHPVIPTFALSITRRGVDVSASATILVENHLSSSSTYSEVTGATFSNGVITCPSIVNSIVYRISVTQGGQTVVLDGDDSKGEYVSKLKFTFMNYRYYGAVSSKPANADAVKTLCQNGTLTKQLSSSTTMSKTALAANKYFVFVIPTTSPDLIVKNANSTGIVDNDGLGTFELARVNDSATLNYKYVIVPASSNAWNFEITN